ncbi:GNAT family N-acetyltransferase [Bacillus sp. THAF10]|uniref:GNAT family N-acetyltransferase n=1 Tax=Bacillus sp. THAF10 TaxID=2587848 RepID=UPI0015625F54|nr:GNAT family N-acetyltransferase [Bacillus sp. THAF10]
MSITESSKPCHIKLRDIRIPEDYEHIATLLNMVEPGSTTAQTLAEEDSQIPTTSNLTLNEEGLLIGFGRTRVIAENDHGQVIGYGAVFRAPWVDAGSVGCIFCAHPDYSGQGVGERILAHLENWANEQ